MLSAMLALSVLVQSPPQAAPPAKASRPATGSIQVLIRMDVPQIPVSKERSALEELAAGDGSGGPEAMLKVNREHPDRWFLVTGPLKVRVLVTYRIPRSDPPRELTQVDILEGPSKGKVAWTFRSFLNSPDGLERLLAVPYEERSRQWSAYLANLQLKQKSSSGQQAKSLAEKRRQKKAARYRAALAREAAEAKAEAEAEAKARKEYKEELPYIVQAQGQMLQRLSQMESNQIQAQRNQILSYLLNQGGYWGMQQAVSGSAIASPPAQPPASDGP